MEQEKWIYKVNINFDGRETLPWPSDLPAPVVGDEITGQFGGGDLRGKVMSRTWGLGPWPGSLQMVAVLTITVESPKSAQPGQATVQPLRL